MCGTRCTTPPCCTLAMRWRVRRGRHRGCKQPCGGGLGQAGGEGPIRPCVACCCPSHACCPASCTPGLPLPTPSAEPPHVLHYGLLWRVPGTDYSFDKHWHYQFDPLSCPPWQIGWAPRAGRGTAAEGRGWSCWYSNGWGQADGCGLKLAADPKPSCCARQLLCRRLLPLPAAPTPGSRARACLPTRPTHALSRPPAPRCCETSCQSRWAPGGPRRPTRQGSSRAARVVQALCLVSAPPSVSTALEIEVHAVILSKRPLPSTRPVPR